MNTTRFSFRRLQRLDWQPLTLQSSTRSDLVVVSTATDFGRHCFALSAPLAWNRLPPEIRNSQSLESSNLNSRLICPTALTSTIISIILGWHWYACLRKSRPCQGRIQKYGLGGREGVGSRPLPSPSSFRPLSSPSPSASRPLPLEVGLLNPASGSGGAL